MDSRLLKYFYAVAKELSITRASKKLHIEQSPLSRAIKKLEVQLDTELFIRGSKNLTLTWPGQVLYSETSEVLQRIEQLKINIASAIRGYQSILKVAICDEINPQEMTTFLNEIHLGRPDLEIRIEQMHYLQAIESLKRETTHTIIAQSNLYTKGLEVMTLWKNSLTVLIPSDHLLATNKRITLKEIIKNPIILFNENYFGNREQIEKMIMAHRITVKAVRYAKSFDEMLALVATGRGLGLCGNDWYSSLKPARVVSRKVTERNKINTYLITHEHSASEQIRKSACKMLQKK